MIENCSIGKLSKKNVCFFFKKINHFFFVLLEKRFTFVAININFLKRILFNIN